MFLSTSATTHPTPKGLNPRRKLGTFASAARATLIQARRIRAGHVTFVLGLTLAVTAAVSLGAFESGASPARPQDARSATHSLTVRNIPAAPVHIVLVNAQDEANQLLAEAYHLQTEAFASVALPSVRIIGNTSQEEQLQDELSMMFYSGVAYRIADLRTK
jgi:hypothetical protein